MLLYKNTQEKNFILILILMVLEISLNSFYIK